MSMIESSKMTYLNLVQITTDLVVNGLTDVSVTEIDVKMPLYFSPVFSDLVKKNHQVGNIAL